MRRHVQGIGIRYWSGQDLLDLQHESLRIHDDFFGALPMHVVSGCEVTTVAGSRYNIAAGLVMLRGKDQDGNDVRRVVPFAGRENTILPVYLKLAFTMVDRGYKSGGVKPIYYDFHAVAVTVKPGADTPYLEITKNGGTSFPDALQDAAHRFITDTERAKWNGYESGLVTDEERDRWNNFDPFPVNEIRRFSQAFDFTDPKYLLCDGSRVSQADYPDLVLDPSWEIKDDTFLRNVSDRYYEDMLLVGERLYAPGQYNIYYTDDFVSWSTIPVLVNGSAITSAIKSIAYGNGLWVLGLTNGQVVTSPDLVNWTARGTIAPSIVFGNGMFVGFSGTTLYFSNDGISWTSKNVSSNITYPIQVLEFFDGEWWMGVSNAYNHSLFKTADFVTFTNVCISNVANYAISALYSFNGAIFVFHNPPGNNPYGYVTYNKGTTWTRFNLPSVWHAAFAFWKGTYILIGSPSTSGSGSDEWGFGRMYISKDLQNWEVVKDLYPFGRSASFMPITASGKLLISDWWGDAYLCDLTDLKLPTISDDETKSYIKAL